jgi:hypothetical protein
MTIFHDLNHQSFSYALTFQIVSIKMVLYVVGIGLLVLGGSAGVALFVRAMAKNEHLAQGPGMTTLWGLFLIGLVAGLMLIAASAQQ